METLKPEEIKELLFKRLQKNNQAYTKIKESFKGTQDYEEYLKEIMYFKYYFDFSSAIEEVNRNILFCKYCNDSYLIETQNIEQESKPRFIKIKHEKLLINNIDEEKTINDIKEFFNDVICCIPDSFYKNLNLNKKINEYENFESYYGTSESTRNRIAHGLILKNVKYDDATLFKFMLSFYTIFTFYCDLYTKQ